MIKNKKNKRFKLKNMKDLILIKNNKNKRKIQKKNKKKNLQKKLLLRMLMKIQKNHQNKINN